MFKIISWIVGILILAQGLLTSAKNMLPAQKMQATDLQRIVFLGDSITYSGGYTATVESRYLTLNKDTNTEFLNLGLMSETVSGLSEPSHPFPRPNLLERLDRILNQTTPDLVIACYGINDGIYHPFNERRFEKFKTGIQQLVDKVVENDCKLILLTPPPFDPEPLRASGKLRSKDVGDFDWRFVYDNYDVEVMARYSRWLLDFGSRKGVTVVDIRAPILDHLTKKRETDPKYSLSSDGVHLNAVGHQIIADAISKQLGIDPVSATNELLYLVAKRQEVLKLAWLAKIGHKRPGVPKGLKLTEAKMKAAEIQQQISEILKPETKRGRTKIKLTNGWKFHLGQPSGDPSNASFNDANWQTVSVPHSHRLYSDNLDGTDDDEWQKKWHRHVGWYRRDLQVDNSSKQKVFLEFEGAHQVTECWVNGHYVGQHAIGGYTPFHFDITRFISESGPTQIALKVDNTYNPDIPPDFGRHDYIMPGGLYRDVYLVQTGLTHFTFDWEALDTGVFITTRNIKRDSADIDVRLHVRNENTKRVSGIVKVKILDRNGLEVADAQQPLNLAKSDQQVFKFSMNVKNPELWSIETPNLYRLQAAIRTNDSNDGEPQIVDEITERFGIRTLRFSKEMGVTLNGKPIELIGANRHQQYPHIGNAVPDNLHFHDIWLLKQAGMNCVRLAHYPQDNAILNACDELGLLVTEEPPTWIDTGGGKWMKNLELAQRRLIRNHRNHPSLFMWAVGINHLGYRDFLQRAAEQEDPSRWTHANAAEWGKDWKLKKGRATIYAEMGFRHAPIILKDDVQFTIEHSRGDRGRRQVASAKRRPNHFGLCVWEAFDNHSLKEKTGDTNLASSGIIDLYRIPRDDYFWYRTELTDEPTVYLTNQVPDPKSPIVVFSNCDQIQLSVNGKQLPLRGPDSDAAYDGLNSPPFTFEEAWSSGEIQVNGYRKGKRVASLRRATPSQPHQLTLDFGLDERTSWPHEIVADGNSIVPIYVRVRDKNGTIVPDANCSIRLDVKGAAEVVGDNEPVNANPKSTRRGYAPFLLRARTSAGRITVTANSPSLPSETLSFETTPFSR